MVNETSTMMLVEEDAKKTSAAADLNAQATITTSTSTSTSTSTGGSMAAAFAEDALDAEHESTASAISTSPNSQSATRRTSASSVVSIATSTSSASTSFAKTFPEKLMELLQQTNDPTHPHYSAAIEWLPHGNSFLIQDPKTFAQGTLPVYFKGSSKYESFTRKLYRWGFRQITKGDDANSYYHEHFQRDDPDQCLRMHCHYSDRELQAQAQSSKAAAARRQRSASSGSNLLLRHHHNARSSPFLGAKSPISSISNSSTTTTKKRSSFQDIRRSSFKDIRRPNFQPPEQLRLDDMMGAHAPPQNQSWPTHTPANHNMNPSNGMMNNTPSAIMMNQNSSLRSAEEMAQIRATMASMGINADNNNDMIRNMNPMMAHTNNTNAAIMTGMNLNQNMFLAQQQQQHHQQQSQQLDGSRNSSSFGTMMDTPQQQQQQQAHNISNHSSASELNFVPDPLLSQQLQQQQQQQQQQSTMGGGGTLHHVPPTFVMDASVHHPGIQGQFSHQAQQQSQFGNNNAKEDMDLGSLVMQFQHQHQHQQDPHSNNHANTIPMMMNPNNLMANHPSNNNANNTSSLHNNNNNQVLLDHQQQEILERHRLEDAVLAEQELTLRRQRQWLAEHRAFEAASIKQHNDASSSITMIPSACHATVPDYTTVSSMNNANHTTMNHILHNVNMNQPPPSVMEHVYLAENSNTATTAAQECIVLQQQQQQQGAFSLSAASQFPSGGGGMLPSTYGDPSASATNLPPHSYNESSSLTST
mmetsp:Transcript_12679/g.22945  ORF Transcript_12679/g.22945 Transcript_12679/m.22945 type:complete len:755 (-) Transcript_12679:304-2568(-)